MASASDDVFGETEQRRQAREGGMHAVGKTLSQRQPPRRRRTPVDPDRDTILEYISDFSREFSDRAPLKSSTTRAYNLYKASELPLETFIDGLYRARSIVKERTGAIRGSGDAGGAPTKSKMAYFFAVLEDLLGLADEEPSSASSP